MTWSRLIRLKRKDRERGQSLAEFALLVPIFLILVFAIVDFGMGFNAWITITNSAREGARFGAVQASGDEIETRVRTTADSLDQSKLTVSVTNAQGNQGESVVNIDDYGLSLITPLAGLVNFVSGDTLGPDLNLSSTADMRLE